MDFQIQDSGRICPSCEWILASGEIEPGDAVKLGNFIYANTPVPKNIRFASPGGELHAALELGAFLRARGFRTYVGDADYVHQGFLGTVRSRQRSVCYSACVYAFAGGVERHAETLVVGIHQFYFADEALEGDHASPAKGDHASPARMAMAQQVTASLDGYVARMGVDPQLVALAATVAPFGAVRLLDKRELAELRLNTASRR